MSAQDRMNDAARQAEARMLGNAVAQGGPACDFCSRPIPSNAGATFDAGSPITGSLEMIEPGTLDAASLPMGFSRLWVACDACAPVVRERDPAKLAEHVFATADVQQVGSYHQERPFFIDYFTTLYTEFFSRDPREIPHPVTW